MRNISLKAMVVLTLAMMLLCGTAAFADGIDVSALGGSYSFSGTVGSVWSTNNLGAGGITVSLLPNPPGPTFNMGTGAILFSTGTYAGGGLFNGGGSISYFDATNCGGLCFSGTTNSSQLVGSSILASFTTNFVSQSFAALVGANFGTTNPNASGSLSIVFGPANSDHIGSIASADYQLTPTPEPASLLLLGSGLLGIGGTIRRKLRLI